MPGEKKSHPARNSPRLRNARTGSWVASGYVWNTLWPVSNAAASSKTCCGTQPRKFPIPPWKQLVVCTTFGWKKGKDNTNTNRMVISDKV